MNDPHLDRSPELLDRHRSQLLIVDMQEKLLPVVLEHEALLGAVEFLLDAAELLRVPVVVSEQYPRGLGPTVASISSHSVAKTTFEKTRFSAAHGVQTRLTEQASATDSETVAFPSQVVLVGIEAHICVLQTAMDLIAQGMRVFVVADAVGSRHSNDCLTALTRLRDNGAVVCTAESVAFEWCEAAGSDEFRQLSSRVRQFDDMRRTSKTTGH